MADKPSVAERLKVLEEIWTQHQPYCGDPDCEDCSPFRELAAIRAEVEAVARELREDGDPTCVQAMAERLAGGGE